MNESMPTLESQAVRERVREIHRSWSPIVRAQRAAEGRQRRAELLQIILKGEMEAARSAARRDLPCDRTIRFRDERSIQSPIKRDANRLGA